MIRVWHAPSLRFDPPTIYPDEYTLVATVATDNPGEAFGLTNHIHHDWTTNDDVVVMTHRAVRSTSVGDVLELADGRHLLVKGIGFKEVVPGKHVFWKDLY